VARFQREAETLAALNHPNIGAIYGLEESGGQRYLILELVEGDTLQERLRRGAIPVKESLRMAVEIATALEAAHEKGVMHRDLKLANIKITPEGGIKVLDFGLARVVAEEDEETSFSNSPTLSRAGTRDGVILGTAAYMSPEQARGRRVDKRTDIFSFGSVLYEMLTGKPAFGGEDLTDILSRVLQREPDWSLLPSDLPPRAHELLVRCLEKDLKKRRRDAGDVRMDLEQALKEPAARSVTPAPAGVRKARLPWMVATGALALIAVVLAVIVFRPAPDSPEVRVQINTPATASPLHFALSPDGRYVAFVAGGEGPERLWLRPLDKIDAQPMPGTDGANYPFWSSDSRSIGFFASGKLYRVDVAGGLPQALTDVALGRGGSWSRDGVIVFTPGFNTPLMRMAASGGDPVPLTKLDPPRQISHRFPNFLPDGRHFFFYAQGSAERAGIYLGSLDGGEPKRLEVNGTAAAYLAPNRVAYVRQGALVVQQLDLERGELKGDPETLADPVGEDLANSYGGFSISADGRVAYRTGGAERRQLTWYDRAGKIVGTVRPLDTNLLVYPELSPDGRRAAVDRIVQGNRDVWLMDLERGGVIRFMFDAAVDAGPIWSADGTRIAFRSQRKGAGQIYVKPSSGAGAEELLLETPNGLDDWPQDWSRDSRFLLYREADPKTGFDLKAVETTGNERRPVIVANTPFDEREGQLSPDGRWVAYATNESGRFEIVVQPFPEPTGKWQVSTGGGQEPRWRADGRELFFIAPDRKLMAASIAPAGSSFQANTPVTLFATRIVGTAAGNARAQYAVSRDGRFLINESVEEATVSPITLILNWKP
jgi:serine/threonine protein kinase